MVCPPGMVMISLLLIEKGAVSTQILFKKGESMKKDKEGEGGINKS
jgi:hypothetical protein